jgi:GGDEF domain-containing protein
VIASDSWVNAGVPISTAFVFATLYLWGFAPAILLEAAAVLLSEMILRKDLWKLMFNVGQYVISVTAAWAVMWLGGGLDPARARTSFQPRTRLIVALGGVTRQPTLVAERGPGRAVLLGVVSEDFWYSPSRPSACSRVAVHRGDGRPSLSRAAAPALAVTRPRRLAENQRQALHDAPHLPNRIAARSSRASSRPAATGSRCSSDLDRFGGQRHPGHPRGRASSVARRLLARTWTPSPGSAATSSPCCSRRRGARRDRGRGRIARLAEPVRLEGVLMDVDVSIGIALSPVHGQDFEQLMRRADVAMYVAKAQGTGIELYDAARDPNSPARLGTVSALREGIEQGQLELHYQPKVSLRDGTVVGVEALVRWQHPERGMVSPAEFIPLAERTGLVHQITAHVARGLLAGVLVGPRPAGAGRGQREHARPARDRSRRPRRRIARSARAAARGHRARGDRERPRARRRPRRRHAARAARARRQRIPGRLRHRLLVAAAPRAAAGDEVKIDRSFVRRLDEEGGDPAMVRSIVDIAHGLGRSVVAEGLETTHAWRLLREFGCDVAQGYRISRPMPSDQATQWLVERVVRGPAERAGLRAVGSARIVADI